MAGIYSIVLTSCAITSAFAQPSRPDLLLMMRSADPADRAVARQLLPREGVAVVEDVLPALADPSQPIWRTASNILCDIANEVSAPGFDADRLRFSTMLLARLAARPGSDEVARLLHILPLALPEGADVSPIAAYLAEPALRMNARDALELAATSEAKAALREALPRADGEFALALIDALDKLGDADAREILTKRLRDRDPVIRVAAARALAWTGEANLVPAFEDIVATASAETQIEAGNAFLSLADAIVARGGQFDYAMDLYAWALSHVDGPALKGAAIAALGRHGDERVVPWILAATREVKPGALDHAALEAFAVLPGAACAEALLKSHEASLKAFGPSIYAAYGRRREEEFLPLIFEAAGSRDAYTQHVAILALLDTDMPEAIQAVARHAATMELDARAPLVDALELKAVKFRRDGNAPAAAAAYAGLYPLAATDDDRRFALDGMMAFPSEEAFALVKDLLGQDDLAGLPVPFLAGIARALYDADRPADAEGILDTLAPRIATPADMQAFLGSVRGAGPALARKLGFVTEWHVIGPFAWSMADAFTVNHVGAPRVDLAAAVAAPNGDPRTWRVHETGGADAIVDLTSLFGMQSNAAAYAYAEINLQQAADAVLRAGSDDGIKIWVNDVVVHEHNVDRGLTVDQDQARAPLVAGKNRVLVEITQGAGGWNMCLRITQPDGRPIEFSQ